MKLKILKYLFYLCIFSIIIGPLGTIPIGILQVSIYVTDIIVGLISLIWLTQPKNATGLIRSDATAKYFCLFAGIAAISLVISPLNLNIGEKFISGLYLIRLLAYFAVYLTVKSLIKNRIISAKIVIRLLTVAGLSLAALGWLQYLWYPDLRNLYYLGWDPHFARIFSTYLDPNYFGLVMTLTLILLFPFRWKDFYRNLAGLFIFATLMFTYSRSSFLAAAGTILYLSIAAKKIKILVIALSLLIISIFLLPRPGGAGVQLERVFSIETRVENWQQAFKIFLDNPISGVGFNSVRYAKIRYNFPQDNLAQNHAGAGFDNSFLFIAVTTGFLGLFSYLIFLRQIFQKADLWIKASLLAVVIHSFFLNSLFFPWVMLWMWIIIGTGRDPSASSR